ERFHDKDENFAAMKVFATFQAAYIEFGSFDLDLSVAPAVLPSTVPADPGIPNAGGITPMERFYDRFGDRKLISDLFTITEAQRVDGAIKRDYAGVRRALVRLQQLELEKRPDPHDLPLREAFVENLVRISLDG